MAGINIRILMLAVLLSLAMLSDLKRRKIPNKLTVTFVLIGIIFNSIIDFPYGILSAIVGIVVGFLVFFLPYLMKTMGAGDVKLMAAIGALTNWNTIIYVALFTAIAGGLITIVAKVAQGGMSRTLRRTGKLFLFYFFIVAAVIFPLPTMRSRIEKYRIDTSDKKNDYIPYALAIAAGTMATIILSRTGVIQGLII